MIRAQSLASAALFAALDLAAGCDKKAKDQAAQQLKAIGKALHDYSVGFELPAGVVGPNKAVGLSWRVAVLPFIGEEKLFKDFKLNEPWDSDHNKALLEKMPAVFASPGKAAEKGHTFVRTTMGPGGVIRTVPQNPPPKGKPEVPPKLDVPPNYNPGQTAPGRKLAEFQDGLSNTILLVEAGEAVPWTKPGELYLPPLEFDRKTGRPPTDATVPPLGGVFADGFHAAMADGRVVFFKTGYPALELAKLLSPIDGLVTQPLDPKKVAYSVPMAPVAKAPAGKAGGTVTKP